MDRAPATPQPGGSADGDLAVDKLAQAMPGRPVRSYPALLSTYAAALAWARAGAPAGALVVADYQVAPRGRAGLPWEVPAPGEALGFSLVLRPDLAEERQGWLYTTTASALADVAGARAAVSWPDEVRCDAGTIGRVGIDAQTDAEVGPAGLGWAVVSVLMASAAPPRAQLLAELVDAIERCTAADPDSVLVDYRARCATLGCTVRARLLPLGPTGVELQGEAVDCLADGALVLRTSRGARVAVRPQHLGVLEKAV